jgi:hypothetical protein
LPVRRIAVLLLAVLVASVAVLRAQTTITNAVPRPSCASTPPPRPTNGDSIAHCLARVESFVDGNVKAASHSTLLAPAAGRGLAVTEVENDSSEATVEQWNFSHYYLDGDVDGPSGGQIVAAVEISAALSSGLLRRN